MDATADTTQIRPWSRVTKIAFRFAFVYFGLFCLLFPQILFVFTGAVGALLPQDAVLWQLGALDPALGWVARTVFGVDAGLHRDSGSGDQTVIWVLVFCLSVLAAVACAVWSMLDRHRGGYPRLWAWLLTFVRLCVAGQMMFYGFAKLIPTQMPTPPLTALLRPFGELSPASVLWLQVGSSPPYEMLLGAVEVVAGVLLFVPRTATLGALVGVISMAQVFLLNMTFDVPVKILSGHLLVMGLLLLAPQCRRLTEFFVLHRRTEPPRQPALFTDARTNSIAAKAQVVVGIWVIAGCLLTGWHSWHEYGGGRVTPDLYGIWTVSRFDMDGRPLAALADDGRRWQRAIFDVPGVLTYQPMTGELIDATTSVDGDTMTLSAPDGSRLGTLTSSRPAPHRLVLTGELSGHPVQMWLDRVDLDQFTLRSRGFHWVQEYPFFT